MFACDVGEQTPVSAILPLLRSSICSRCPASSAAEVTLPPPVALTRDVPAGDITFTKESVQSKQNNIYHLPVFSTRHLVPHTAPQAERGKAVYLVGC
jgi:hypothetical protein